MTIALLVTGIGVLLLLGVGALHWHATRSLEGVLDDPDAALPALPEGHRPPPGLGPISPSERAVTAEVERGLRDLELFLLDVA
ncbi:MAG: hypothetical protein ABR549_15080 [Mycobacteriales bacterium]